MITLIGHGYVGSKIAEHLLLTGTKFTWVSHHDFNAPLHDDVIINAAGYTGKPNVDTCEIHKAETVKGNVAWPLLLEELAGDIPVVHISSGCVYTGYTAGGWTETDAPNFNFENGSFYSGTKALAQDLLTPYMDKSYLLRIRMPFSADAQSSNLFTKLMKYPKLIDFENSVTNVEDCADVAIHFATQLPPLKGIYNVCNPGSTSTRKIADALGLTKEWFTPEEFSSFVTAPRSNCVLNTDKLQSVFPIQSAEESISTTASQYLANLRK